MVSSIQEQSLLKSAQNGLRILRLFSREKSIWGTTEIARELELPKSTVSRLLDVLCREGLIEKAETKYRLGLSLLNLSGVIKYHMEIKREAAEPLQSLVDKMGETAMIPTLEEEKVIYLLKIECKQPSYLHGDIGENNPATCSSSGKVLLAHLPMKRVDELLQAGIPKMGPNSVTNPETLKEQLQTIKKQGYCICIDEMHENSISIAAPIKDYTGQVVTAVSLIGRRNRMSTQPISDIVEVVVKTAKDISYQLGYIGAE
ncbi:IclR family transcriptional regulator [Peribacillus simplex]|uniref:IclR family transcriptional regulator n=1 Tax=Peribacillus simplex TaxID=1478 RepID=UPI00137B15CE|nr:IclR family transcriptional regulator [Peribacillus simplex]MBD8591620.1 IclR family transcriptional regulator [Peribacillus simplex]NCT39706.1 IclR family transcriptional regulator [Peribacillus frigoritolerans]